MSDDMNYIVLQDGDTFGDVYTREEAANHVESIAESLSADAGRFAHMAEAIRTGEDGGTWRHDGSYLSLEIQPDEES